MKREIDQGLAIDPVNVTQLDTMDRMNQAYAPEIQGQQQDDQAQLDQAFADDAHKKQIELAKAQPKPSSSNK